MGTAHGFACEKGGRQLFVLPGPPAEVSSIWYDHIEKQMRHVKVKVWTKNFASENGKAHLSRLRKALANWIVAEDQHL